MQHLHLHLHTTTKKEKKITKLHLKKATYCITINKLKLSIQGQRIQTFKVQKNLIFGVGVDISMYRWK